jgi:hypothetical protein
MWQNFCFISILISLQKETKKAEPSSDGKTNEIQTDVQKLSKKEQAKLFLKEAPEFVGIFSDFEEKMKEAEEKLSPIVKAIKAGTIPRSPAAEFVLAKYNIILKY